MARIRTIKPEFFTSEDIVSLSPMARLLYIATWCEADREGRLLWKPRTFKLRYFPGDDCDIEQHCSELIERGLIVLYGDGLAHVPSFHKHQHINPRESATSLPEPRVAHASSRVSDDESTVTDAQVGKEGKGRSKDASRRDSSVSVQALESEGVDSRVAADWLTLRRAKKLPLTPTAWDGTKAEGLKAGLSPAETVAAAVANNWAGFKAAWYTKEPAKVNGRKDIFAGLEK